MRLSVNSHQKRCALFCYGLRRVSGTLSTGQTTFFCNIQINAVETCATQQQNLDTQIFQFTDNFCGNFVINERASSVMTCCQMSCSGVSPSLKKVIS